MKNIGSVIDKEFNSACKEQLGKSFGEGMSMVPKAGLTKKVSPGSTKIFHSQEKAKNGRMFETIDEAKRRAKNAPKRQKRSHVPSTVDGNPE